MSSLPLENPASCPGPVAPVAIEARGLTRRFGETLAVDDVSFRVAGGEIVGLLGPNGAGKTTTLRMLATLLTPDRGEVDVCGRSSVDDARAVRASIGYQTGDTGLYARLTPLEFLRYFGRLHSMDEAVLARRVDELVARFAIGDFAEQRCGTLSTGQKQRVSIARALLHDPPVLILDEPTSGLDIVSSHFVLSTLEEVRAEGRAVIFSTHILTEVELVCDRVLVLHEGRICARGTVRELIAETGSDDFARAFLALVGLGAARDEVSP